MKRKLALLFLIAAFTFLATTAAYGRLLASYPTSYSVQNAVRFHLFDPDFTQYYGAPLFYSPFGYYSYGPFLNPPPVWIPPPPMTLFTNVVSQWIDPGILMVMWKGDTARTRRITVALLDGSRNLLLVSPTGITLQPHIVTVRVPRLAVYIDVTTFDAPGRKMLDITVPLPPR
ncbi:MAG: hypothetical protein Q7T82_12110 [Armatimonadota bacterium]|nr:hypothetical protein [Armatimonadota bacterium]